MALPQFKVAGALAIGTSGTTLTTVIPAGMAIDEGMILQVMHNGASGFTTPTNWTLIGAVVNNANQSSAFFAKKFQAGDANPATTTATMSTTSAGYGRITAYRNVDASATWYEAAVLNVVSGTPTTSTTPQSSGIVTTGTDRLDVVLVSGDDDPDFTSGMPPSPWVRIGQVSSTTGGDALMDGIFRPHFTAGTTAAVTVGTWAARYWRTLSLGIIGGTGLSVRHYAVATSTTTPKSTPTIEWKAGDLIFVVGSAENNTVLLDTPTLTGETFVSYQDLGPPDNPTDTGPMLQSWQVASAATGGSAAISMTRNAGSISTNYGFQVWIVSGGATIAQFVANLTETAPSMTVAAGSIVAYIMNDWNATAAGKTLTAGSGYSTKRVDVLNTGYSVLSGDWADVAAGTFSFGASTYATLNVAHIAVEFAPVTGAQTVNLDPGILSLSGVQPTLAGTGDATQTLDVGAVALSGVQPTLAGSGTVTQTLDIAALALAGVDIVATTGGSVVNLDTAILSLVGIEPTLSATGTATVDTGTSVLILGGVQPTISGTGFTGVPVDTGNVALTGVQPTLAASGTATAPVDPAALLLTGITPTIEGQAIVVNLDTAALILAGVQPALAGSGDVARTLDVAALALAGIQPTLAGSGATTQQLDSGLLILAGVEPTLAATGAAVVALDSGLLLLVGIEVAAFTGTSIIVITGRFEAVALDGRRTGIVVDGNRRAALSGGNRTAEVIQ